MKANCKQTAVKLTTSKIDTHIMVWLVTKYGTVSGAYMYKNYR